METAILDISADLKGVEADNLMRQAVAQDDDGNTSAAIELYCRVLTMKPNLFKAAFNLALAYEKLERHQEAADVLNNLIAIFPTDARAWHALSIVYQHMEVWAASAACGERACQLEPRNAVLRWDRCQTFLSMGDFVAGWDGAEARFSSQKEGNYMRDPVVPYLETTECRDKTLLIFSEQGIGEELMAATMYAEAAANCGKMILEVNQRLMGLMRRTFPNIEVYSAWQNADRVEAYRKADYQLPALNLGRFLRHSFDDFEDREGPLLIPDDAIVTELRAKYEALANGRPIIGVAWRSDNPDRMKKKSIPVQDLAAIYTQDAFFVSLQYNEREETREWDVGDNGVIYRDKTVDHYDDYDRPYAQVCAMDAVVTTSNAIMHTAGIAGVPTMAIIPGGKWRHWYWFLRRHDCPWYPSITIFRPEPATDGGKWYGTSVKRIAAQIAQIVSINAPKE